MVKTEEALVLSELVDQVQMVYDRRILSKEMI